MDAPQVQHLILYDGLCGLCNGLVQFLLRHDRCHLFSVASLQSALGRAIVEGSGENPEAPTSFYVVADYRTAAPRLFVKSEAVLFIAGALGWPWRAAQSMRVVPHTIRDHAYDVVARNRYGLFGRFDRCLMPTPEFRNRFVD